MQMDMVRPEAERAASLAAQLDAILREFPAARWHQWEADSAHSARAGAMLAFGKPTDVRYDFSRAKVVVHHRHANPYYAALGIRH